MSRDAGRNAVRIDRFFAGPGARADQWCHLMELANAWANGTGDRAAFEAALAEMTPTEEFHAYPGHQLMAALREHARPMTRTPPRPCAGGSPAPCLPARFARMPATGMRTMMAKVLPRSLCIRPSRARKPIDPISRS